MEQALCECGCGNPIPKVKWRRKRPIRYIHGHYKLPKTVDQNEILAPAVLCKCGCGEYVPPRKRSTRKVAEFCIGHWSRTAKWREAYVPTPDDEIPNGLCYCGCGGKTRIAERNILDRKIFKGHPLRYIVNHHQKITFPALTGPDNPRWKGGKIATKEGYVLVRKPKGHPSKRPYIPEHRFVMEQSLGRYLEAPEQVHHINGNKQDNRLENLELWKNSQPSGVRSADYHCVGCRCSEIP